MVFLVIYSMNFNARYSKYVHELPPYVLKRIRKAVKKKYVIMSLGERTKTNKDRGETELRTGQIRINGKTELSRGTLRLKCRRVQGL